MDNDKQIPLKFLDESEDCCDRLESTVLGLAHTIPQPLELDQALRAVHSVKGGAAMMGFTPLSRVAHQLEDFFKILRVRHHTKSVGIEVETLLLEGVDALRQVIDLHRRGTTIDEQWLVGQLQPIFDRLHQHLGELRAEDEDILLAQEGDINPGILLFDNGVLESLDWLESQLSSLSPAQLRPELVMVAEELSEFGRMAEVDQFVNLCQLVKEHSQIIDLPLVVPFSRQALQVWRKSHSLVMLGRVQNIPWQLPELPAIFGDFDDAHSPSEFIAHKALDLSLLQLEINVQATAAQSDSTVEEIPEFPAADDFDQAFDPEFNPAEFDQAGFDPEYRDLELLSEVDAALAKIENPELSLVLDDDYQLVAPVVTAITTIPTETITTITTTNSVSPDRTTVRVPVEYLQQFNTVFGQLILERNAINLRLAEIQSYTSLMRQRMRQLESSNQTLQQRYDPVPVDRQTVQVIPPNRSSSAATANFDQLEMDHYSDLHQPVQEQVETIGKLQEVTTDIELSLQEMAQSVRSLNQTTRALQKNVVRTQMLPFGDVAKRLPRLIRDLSVQFNKDVHLQVVGENTSVDRAILENLSDPLLHLVRNAFGHGIEDQATRLAAGKAAAGSITVSASQRGGATIITIADDGGGIDLELIRQQLQHMGLPTAEVVAMSEAQLLDRIFEPGLSTAPSLTELSGRGVGLDVVKTNIEEVRGTIQVKTQPGVGTTFTISVPFALSIVRVMLLERAGFVFAVAVDTVQEIIPCQPNLLNTAGTQLNWQSQTIPVVAIEQGINFGRSYRPVSLPGNPAISKPTILITGGGAGLPTAFYIDRFWGEKEVTLRPIDSPCPLTPGFGNSIILGDGRVVPLIDLEQFASWLDLTSLPDRTTPARSARLPQLAAGAPLLSSTILVIDDSLNVRRYLAMVLEREGYQVEQAQDGQEAVDKLYAGLVVQAVLCDIEMPRLDGYGVLDAVRSHPALTDLPIVMLTSRSSEKHRQLALNLGASAYFTKPYTESELLAQLKFLVGQAAPYLSKI